MPTDDIDQLFAIRDSKHGPSVGRSQFIQRIARRQRWLRFLGLSLPRLFRYRCHRLRPATFVDAELGPHRQVIRDLQTFGER